MYLKVVENKNFLQEIILDPRKKSILIVFATKDWVIPWLAPSFQEVVLLL